MSVQVVDGLHIFYINNCIVIPKSINKKYKIAEYFYRYFKIVSLVNVDENVFRSIKHIKIYVV